MSESERQPLLIPPEDPLPIRNDSVDGWAIDDANIPQELTSPTLRIWSIFFPLALGVFLSALDNTIVTASYATIGSDLKQLQNTSWIATGYMLTTTAFQPLYGKLCDIFGRKACLLFVYLVFGVGCLVCGLARNMETLIAARILAGIGGGGLQTIASIILSDIIPLRQRGTWQGYINIIWSVGASSGAPIGGFLSDTIGWRWAFFIQVPITAIAFLAVVFLFHEKPSQQTEQSTWAKTRRIDFLGAITLIIAVFTLLLGLDSGSNISWIAPITYVPLLVAGISSVAFAFVEVTPTLAKEPFAPKHIITNHALLACYFTNFFVIGAAFCGLFQVPLYVQAVLRKSASTAGAILIPAVFTAVMGSLLVGVVMQYTVRYKRLAIISMVCMVLGSLYINVMVEISASYILYGIAAALALIRVGEGMANNVTLISIISTVTLEDQAMATALNYLFRSLGGLLGISIGSAIVQYSLKFFLGTALAGKGVDIDHIVRHVRESLSYVDTLDPVLRTAVRESYERALAGAFWFTTGLSVCGLFASFYVQNGIH
ncbi:hypothetical protein M422DRAFT_243851 [Sphaerobolus stellatus SS14]|nr:hypothetical protein M422DRAFT_243851 [Sphaerobolus stellatus SS14]